MGSLFMLPLPRYPPSRKRPAVVRPRPRRIYSTNPGGPRTMSFRYHQSRATIATGLQRPQAEELERLQV